MLRRPMDDVRLRYLLELVITLRGPRQWTLYRQYLNATGQSLLNMFNRSETMTGGRAFLPRNKG